jgi:hypothetical protein
MKIFLMLATLFGVAVVALVVFNMWTPSFPAMPWVSPSAVTGMMENILSGVAEFDKQFNKSLPLLEELGYEVTSFRVEGGLQPWAKLCLRAKVTTEISAERVDDIRKQATEGKLISALITSAAVARDIQRATKLGTAVIDVDFALPPKIKMSFSKLTANGKDSAEPYIEGFDPACGQANSGK